MYVNKEMYAIDTNVSQISYQPCTPHTPHKAFNVASSHATASSLVFTLHSLSQTTS